MPIIGDLLKKEEGKKRFVKSNYRPWNFMEQIDKERITPSIAAKTGSIVEELTTEKKQLLPQIADTPQKISVSIPTEVSREPKEFKKIPPCLYDEPNVDKIFRLSGHQKILFYFVAERCFSRGVLSTGAINNVTLIELLKTSSKMVKTTIHRLVGKKLITRQNGKRGRGGFCSFSIDESIRAAMLEYKRLLAGEDEFVIKKISGENYINTSNRESTKGEVCLALSEEWQNIDIEPLAEIGFTRTHLTQISSQNKLFPQVVQDSIYAFAFDLKENGKEKSIKGDIINFFMGILRNGKPYAPSSNYESPQDKAVRIYLERMREIEKKRVEAEKEVFLLEFNNWFRSLSDEQKLNLLPEAFRHSSASLENNKILESSARNHFEKEVWVHRKAAIQQTTSGT